ncbi:hypothetical protein BC936DRAFT_148653 [Jimgerdemannia flammicorona]|uniref:Nop domain-containing protein n=1 Tax=Jimgerdemannia flammicorona TaxID=994334 RepID=A0A433D2K1_9FUNG|nr:hypothetical protein BC936DRAFT_148653 [Jimgerdemannia flammicorona]
MSLADELQADLDLLEGGEEDQEEDQQQENADDSLMDEDGQPAEGDGMQGIEEEEPEKDRIEKIEMGGLDDVKKVSKLMQGRPMQEVLKKIAFYKSSPRDSTQAVGGPVEEDPEYKLIVQANSLTVDIDTEILAVHKFIRDHYNQKFPELESLVLNPLDYARAVKAIGEEMDITRVDLRPILPSATIMVVTVTGSTTNGRVLTNREWQITEEACDLALELDGARRTIIDYVESRMSFIAPNLSQIVGSATAAKMLGAAGGLTALSKMPACNVLGASKRAATGFSNATAKRHTGYIYHSEVCTRAPVDLRMKIQRMAAAKCVLAARIDRAHEAMDGILLFFKYVCVLARQIAVCELQSHTSNFASLCKLGSMGHKMREEIDHKIEKLQEAPPSKTVKALPAPDDAPKKRRGGRRCVGWLEIFPLIYFSAPLCVCVVTLPIKGFYAKIFAFTFTS